MRFLCGFPEFLQYIFLSREFVKVLVIAMEGGILLEKSDSEELHHRLKLEGVALLCV